ncbi:hypothetical protein IMG5_069500 [Ichthyophthirius multifiliis]|uniref:asparaginase n=1 Tax=Ichthyophthirius multifiliis TaxID=5932 RepID=G0QPL8_ICHMU|nr:hypothetical protein IMG5_069500 [Ichthyophthirius multifiliis]EGR32836.1 hypothetical protein IMG5_069500 [Ichthyophthirius multifiliis]|eukprot:XP_004036822.1 hypothetical protein IMG5_069500 [Ichthyophthirius multifiliis]
MKQQIKNNILIEDKRLLIINAGGQISAEDIGQSDNSILLIQNNSIYNMMKSISYFCDLNFTYQNAPEGFLITPQTEYNKRIYYKIIELDDLNINQKYFNYKFIKQLCEVIEKNYNSFDSFIVLHGTDSMCYTASFLSFIIENLSKPIIFTGNMVPLSIMRNDCFNNLLGALSIAGHFSIPEVLIYFHNKLYRANRTKKIDCQKLDCFQSPSYPLLGQVKIGVQINWNYIYKQEITGDFYIEKDFPQNFQIEIVKYHPLFSYESLRKLIDYPNIKGIIFLGYGQSHLPIYDQEFIEIIEKAYQNDISLVVISQSLINQGNAKDLNTYKNLKIAYGSDMTLEAALAKLYYLIVKGYNKEEILEIIHQNIRGEITVDFNNQKFEKSTGNIFREITSTFQNKICTKQQWQGAIKDYIVPIVLCYMVQMGYIHYLQEMKNQNTDFNFTNYDQRAALHLAVREQQIQAVQFLLSENVDVNVVDDFGISPLYQAILTRNKKIIFMLQKHGANLIANYEDINNILFQSALQGDLEIIKILYHTGLKNLNQYKNIDQRNIGHIAASENKIEIIKFLKYTVHFDFCEKDIWDRTPLDDAIYFKNQQIIEMLNNVVG